MGKNSLGKKVGVQRSSDVAALSSFPVEQHWHVDDVDRVVGVWTLTPDWPAGSGSNRFGEDTRDA